MPVAPIARIAALPAPVTKSGIAARTPTATAALAGVLKLGLTWPQVPPSGSRRSRPIENMRRTVAPWMARVQT